MDDKKIVAIIPARGGSKGLPGKNIKLFLGMPLIAYAIETLKSTNFEIDIIISTDSKEIAKVGLLYGITSIMRPPELATDSSLVIDAIKYTIGSLQKQNKYYDVLLLIEPTNPLRDAEDIHLVLEYLNNNNSADCVATFSKLEHPVTRLWSIKNGKPETLIPGSDPFKRRQDQEYGYYINGLAYAFNISKLEENNYLSLFNGEIGAVITEKKVIDIDDKYDFFMAEQMMNYIQDSRKL